jgi:hypothetical protein
MNDGSMYVVVTGYSAVSPDAFQGCAAASLTADLRLSLPVVLYEGSSLHADLEYSPLPDGTVRFLVLDYGQN